MKEPTGEQDKESPNGWENIFREKGEVFPAVQENMPEIAELFKKEGVRDILDLACGAGRHSVYLAEQGFNVSGIDASPSGIEITRRRLEAEKLEGDFRVGNIYDGLPYPDGAFQAIVSTQAMHHGRIEEIRKLITEMKRVLTPGGNLFLTVSKEQKPGDKEIAPKTFVPTSGGEKDLPHYYFGKDGLEQEFGDFDAKIWEESDGKHLCLLGKLKTKK